MALSVDQILDLLATTLKNLGPGKATDLMSDIQRYTCLPDFMVKEKVSFRSGTSIQWRVLNGTSGASRDVGLYYQQDISVGDVVLTADIPWRHSTTNYAFERREIAMNRAPSMIVNLAKIRRKDAMTDLAKHMETRMWGKPADSTDQVTPYGIPMYVVKASSGDGSFQGGNPAGFSSGVGGLSSSTYTRWQNWAGVYVNPSKQDLVAKMRKATVFTEFTPPNQIVPDFNRGNRKVIYCNYTTLSALETIAEQQNDNLGRDVASMDGKITFRQNPVVWVPQLESDTTNPVYGINWGYFSPVFLEGEYMVEQGPDVVPGQPTTLAVNVDLTWNTQCTDRRSQWVLSQ